MMSENLFTEPIAVEDSYRSRVYPVVSKSDSSTENILMESQGTLNYESTHPQLPTSNLRNLQRNQMLMVSVSNEMPSSHQMKQLDPMANNMAAQQILVPNWQMEQMQTPDTNSGMQKSLLTNKRKAALELISNDPSTKKVAQPRSLSNSSGMPALSMPNKKIVPMSSMSNSPRSITPSKKKLPTDTVVNRSQSHAQNKRNIRAHPPSKSQSESSNPVRSKLRESLAAALALVSQGHENSSNPEKSNSQTGSKELEHPVTPRPASDTGNAANLDPEKAGDAVTANVSCPVEEHRDIKSSSETVDPKHITGDTVETWKFVGQEFQSNPVLPYEDASFNDSFFGKDELLLGNGLSWAMELDVDIVDVKETEADNKAKLTMHEDTCNDAEPSLPCSEPKLPSPESIASKIEAELFKLFGDVNKKYKEKGRSLLFNLKDKNNPELRERVMSGEIPPERLCSMTAEELASKELSEWRIAKAEELAQMKVLPDTEVDLRRLVKKTHKGEFQVVEVERDVSAPVDIAVGASRDSEDQSRVNRRKAERPRDESPVQAHETKVKEDSMRKECNTGDQDGQCQLTIPSDSGDMMQGLMVDDMKDLPPIVSLDEFMESLDKEPPFENLHGDSGKTTSGSGKGTFDVGGETSSSDQTSKDPGKMTDHKSDAVDSKSIKLNAMKPTYAKKGSDIYPASSLIKGERIWEGLLQLSISSMANFVGIYKSGEKTHTKEWPRFFEIKGRVRLDAFQRFLQDLPMSRSRAVMVVHFVLAEGCTDNDSRNLQELVDSYAVDQRLGFAEPAPGFEIYFVPPHTATLDMLSKQLMTDYTEALKAIETGLIGVVIWRKVPLTPSTTLHKDSTKRQQQHYYAATPSIRLPEKDMLNSNANFASRSVAPSNFTSRSISDNNNIDDDDDDVPPGFGPSATKRDDDDLPEFKFSGGGGGRGHGTLNHPSDPQRLPSPTPPPSVDRVRQLIQKYGKTENNSSPSTVSGIALQPWNDDDDDDDIPEWQPEAPPAQQQIPPPPPPHPSHVGRQPPILPPHVTNLTHLQQQPLIPLAQPMQPLQPPLGGGGSGSIVGWWPGSPGNMQPSRVGSQNQGREHRGASGLAAGQQSRQWRPDGYNRSRGRGF